MLKADNKKAKKPEIKGGICYSHGSGCSERCIPPLGVEEIENCPVHYVTNEKNEYDNERNRQFIE